MENGTQQLGKYTLRNKIATGGMAEIWLSEQQGPGGFTKELVIKRILPHLASDARFVEMFLDEARLAAKLSHPNIVQIYDLGEADGSYFIAMEYIKGHDLEAIINQCNAFGERIDPGMAARIMADACAALDYAHTFADSNGHPLNLVHRDISPQNILVSEKGVVKLVDFGVAKAASSSHVTQAGAIKGKFCYMSPEQIASKALDGRSDLFAMGIVLYELLTGRRPFGHESDMMAVTAILNQPPPPPGQFGAQLPPGLESVLFRSLEKDPNRRFQSADGFQTALEQYLNGTGVLVRTKELAHYMAGLFGDGPRRSGTQLAGPALADTQLSDGFAAAGSNGPVAQRTSQPVPTGSAPGPSGPPPTGSAPQPVSVGVASQPQPNSPPSNPHQLIASPHGEETRSLSPGAPAPKHTSRGIGPGLIVILVFVLAALAGGGYMLFTMLGENSGSEDAVSESDAGEDTSTVDTVLEEDGLIAQSDSNSAPDTSAPDSSGNDSAAATLPTADAQEEEEDLGDDTALAQTDTSPEEANDVTGETAQEAGDAVAVEAGPSTDATEQTDTAAVDESAVEVAQEDTAEEDTAAADTAGEEVAQEDTAEEDTAEEDTTAVADTAGEEVAQEDTAEQDTAAAEEVAESDTGTREDTRRRDRTRDERPGRITVTVAPPGRYVVLMGDEELGSTPLRGHELPPGRHRITVRSADGSLEETRRVRIRPNRNESVFFDFRD